MSKKSKKQNASDFDISKTTTKCTCLMSIGFREQSVLCTFVSTKKEEPKLPVVPQKLFHFLRFLDIGHDVRFFRAAFAI